jgi:NAD(P)-dependent dehydrogenase (short-subunit alcohol dehydrogenase family)
VSAAGGIGRAMCKAFAQAGIQRIIIVSRTIATLEEVKTDLESQFPDVQIVIHAASVLDAVAIQRIVRYSGKIDFVISAAAICHPVTPTSTIEPSVLSEILQTNTVGPFSVISTILHERVIQGWDHDVKVMFISSALSHVHISHLSGYAASKAAMNVLNTHLHVQWNGRGVSFFSVHPGLIYTGLTGKVFPADSPIWEDGKPASILILLFCMKAYAN